MYESVGWLTQFLWRIDGRWRYNVKTGAYWPNSVICKLTGHNPVIIDDEEDGYECNSCHKWFPPKLRNENEEDQNI